MDAIREQLKRPLVVGVVGLIVGIILGVFYGWVVNPVEWTDADISHLRKDLQVEYLRMAIDSYAYNRDASTAMSRYNQLGEKAPDALAGVVALPGMVKPEDITAFSVAVGAGSPLVPGVTLEPEGEQPARARVGLSRILFPLLCVILLVGIAIGVFLFIYRGRTQTGGAPTQVKPAPPRAAPRAEWQEYAAGAEPPMVQFMASYRLGDDLFDDSFSIDSPAGEFLGECGVSISDTIGVGEPKRVSAFEVWLFDKNDIQTVTKVFMSAHAFLDDIARQRLAAKGEPVLAEPGAESVLETQTLRLVARVVDMGYGDGALPEQSYFDRLILELGVWSKV